MSHIATWLVDAGALYVITWGIACEDWHDAVDWALLKIFDYGPIPDEKHIMTTWHSNEPVEEAFWFAGHSAFHPTEELVETLILDVSPANREAAIMESYSKAQVCDE
nr:hypothetical protein [Aurantiacibacter aquimixticola]